MQTRHQPGRATMIPLLKSLLACAIVKYFEGEIDVFRVLKVNTILLEDMLRAKEPALHIAAIRLAYLHQQLHNGMSDLLRQEIIQGLMGSILERLTFGDPGRSVSWEGVIPGSNRPPLRV